MHQAESEKSLVQVVEDKYREQQPNRIIRDRRLISNQLEYLGKFFFQWDSQTSRLQVRPGQVSQGDYPQLNLQKPMIDVLMSKLNSREVGFKMIGGTREQEDINAAAVADRMLRRDAKFLGVHGNLRDRAILAALVFGDSLAKVFWDPGTGMCFECNGTQLKLGDLGSAIRTPLAFGVDPMAETLEDAAWIMEYCVRSVDWVKEKYPETGKRVGAESLDRVATYQLRLKSYMDNSFYAQADKTEKTVVKEYWEAPTSKFPKGRVLTVASGVLLESKVDKNGDEANPYTTSSGKPFYPYAHFGAVPVSGSFWHKSPIELTSWEQKGYNQIFWIIREWFKRVTPKVFARKNSLSERDQLSNEYLQVVEYQGNEPPKYTPPPELPTSMFQHMNDYKSAHEQTAGIHASTHGKQQTNVRSNAHFMMLVEQDAQKVGPMIDSNERAWEDYLKKMSYIVQKFRPAPAIAKIVGRDMEFKIPDYQAANLGDGMDVEVVKGSMMPRSQPLAIQWAMEWYKNGFYGQPGSKEARRALERHIGKDNAYLDPSEDDEMAAETARQENALMDRGHMPKPPGLLEFHDIHMYEHQLRQNQPDYRNQPQNIQDAHLAHYVEHIVRKNEATQLMMAIQGMSAPQPQQQMGVPQQAPQPPQRAMPVGA